MTDKESTGWLQKVGWQLISFKFLSFWVSVILLVLCWGSLQVIFLQTVDIATTLHKQGYINQDAVKEIITHSLTTLYDSALSHILVFAGVIISGIMTIKGVSYYTDSKQTQAVIHKMNGDATKEDLKKFLPKKGQ